MSRNSGNGGYSPYAVIVFIALLILIAFFIIGKYVWIFLSVMLFFMWDDMFSIVIKTKKQKIIITIIALILIILSLEFALKYSGR